MIALTLVGCTSAAEPPRETEAPIASNTPTEEPSTPAPVAPDEDIIVTPVESYLAWLAASREPDAVLACSLMTDELQKRMISEFAGTLGTQFPDCKTMITATAAMYSATGASADVNVEVVSETASEATLFSTYVGSGKCGTIHLKSTNDGWMLTEQSEGCVR
ncbi:hypothetical protein ACTU6V_10525 [Microbacterium sp. A204]|uniref:hypothetical protein n=1 Tax=Microbacterium sp. A204 TaxID=3457321 RepID=UPI003FCF61FB